MAVNYKVVFEHFNEKYKVAGVADNRTDMSVIAGSVSSKGSDHTALIIDYSCNTPLNNELFVVYTREVNDVDNDVDTFYNMIITDGEAFPSDKDLFLYKIEKSATDRVSKLNASYEEAGLKDRKAVMATINMNAIYNVAVKVEEPEEVVTDDPVEETSTDNSEVEEITEAVGE